MRVYLAFYNVSAGCHDDWRVQSIAQYFAQNTVLTRK